MMIARWSYSPRCWLCAKKHCFLSWAPASKQPSSFPWKIHAVTLLIPKSRKVFPQMCARKCLPSTRQLVDSYPNEISWNLCSNKETLVCDQIHLPRWSFFINTHERPSFVGLNKAMHAQGLTSGATWKILGMPGTQRFKTPLEWSHALAWSHALNLSSGEYMLHVTKMQPRNVEKNDLIVRSPQRRGVFLAWRYGEGSSATVRRTV